MLYETVREDEAARILNQSKRTLQAWRRSGQGPQFIKQGRSVRYPLAALEEYQRARLIDRTTNRFGYTPEAQDGGAK